MLITQTEQLSKFFPRSKLKLQLRGILVWLKTQRVLDITLRLERNRTCGGNTARTRPAWETLTLGGVHTADTNTMLGIAVETGMGITHSLRGGTTGHGVLV
jgi:hypothetical protein